MAETFNKNRIVKNSVLLYVRMAFTMWMNLYATRLVLQNLGVEDMGVYGVVGSIVGFSTFFTNGIVTAIQRFITYELGRDEKQVNNVFCTSINVILLLSLVVVLLTESIGLWVLQHKLNIPDASRDAAVWVFHLSILTFVFNLLSIPYNALILAHEKMDAYAAISMLQVFLSCASAYCISFIADSRLLWYAVIMSACGILIRIIYQVYCRRKFAESSYRFYFDPILIRKMCNFAGISTLSTGLYYVRVQGLTFVVNWTFGVAINAVYTLAEQVQNSILSFALNIYRAISPQITKTYAQGDLIKHKKLVYSSSKISAYMIYFIVVPFLFRTEYIMQLWLGNVPEYAVAFVRCTVFVSLCFSFCEPISTAVFATANIRKYSINTSAFELLVLPISYVLCVATGSPVTLMVCVVIFRILSSLMRIYYASKVTVLRISEMLRQILLPCLMVAAVSCVVCYLLARVTPETLLGLIVLLLVNSIALAGFIYFCGLNQSERRLVTAAIHAVRQKIKKR